MLNTPDLIPRPVLIACTGAEGEEALPPPKVMHPSLMPMSRVTQSFRFYHFCRCRLRVSLPDEVSGVGQGQGQGMTVPLEVIRSYLQQYIRYLDTAVGLKVWGWNNVPVGAILFFCC